MSRITAPDMTRASDGMKYTKVSNPEGCTVDDKAKSVKSSIALDYDLLYFGYKYLNEGFTKIAESGMCGTKLKNQVRRLATRCKNQGKYCKNRKAELDSLFKYSNLEARIEELEKKLNL